MRKMELSFSVLFLTRLLSKNCASVSHEVVQFVQKKVVLLTISMALTYPINGKVPCYGLLTRLWFRILDNTSYLTINK